MLLIISSKTTILNQSDALKDDRHLHTQLSVQVTCAVKFVGAAVALCSLRAYSAKGWLTVYGTRPESRTASQAESCLQNSRSREFNLESRLSNRISSNPKTISLFRPEFQLKNTFDPALRGVAEMLSFDDLSGDETVSPNTNLCSLSRVIIGKSHNVMRFSSRKLG
ncbi:hypothetical protein AVEN_194790-1 [Araneus ventricosus]|uniref:Uncharacterized protein n=1 Tax=Araneus ventricosus TaxID=182803 RepID=A0A4Y2B4Z5_ARAVE|nr:hypothetical protein AVEN_194790-1 [Araneus ventricosus]